MSNLTLWEPRRNIFSVQEAIDRMFDNMLIDRLSNIELFGTPSVDMYQSEEDVVVKATIPGLKAEDIQISMNGDVLTIRGEVKKDDEVKNAAYHLKERSYSSFSRSIQLPTSVTADKAKAEFENGFLTLILP